MRCCKDCKYYEEGVPECLRRDWDWSNWGRNADGICTLYFPRGYIGREPPHPARAAGCCFQFEERPEGQFVIGGFQ